MEEFEKRFEDTETELRALLEQARSEITSLDLKREKLSATIGRIETMLGVPQASAPADMTLHEALITILEERGNEWTHVRDLASAVNDRALYRKKDGTAVEPNQVHARAKNYPKLFEKEGPMVRLGEGTISSPRGSKYDALRNRLNQKSGNTVTWGFGDIDEMVGGLPKSAYRHSAWWANEEGGSHVQARAWMSIGWEVDHADLRGEEVTFRRS